MKLIKKLAFGVDVHRCNECKYKQNSFESADEGMTIKTIDRRSFIVSREEMCKIIDVTEHALFPFVINGNVYYLANWKHESNDKFVVTLVSKQEIEIMVGMPNF